MKMICPHCGLGGTATVELYGRKVRCPDCRKVFLVSDEVIVGFPEVGAIEQSIMGHQEEVVSSRDGVDVRDDNGEPDMSLSDSDLGECSRCGFSFSMDFLKIIDGEHVCPACAEQFDVDNHT